MVTTAAGRFAPRKYHAPPAIAMSKAAIPAASGPSDERFFGATGSAGFAASPRRDADLQRVNPDGVGDVLEFGGAEVADSEIEPALDLTIGVLGEADRARLSDAFESRGDIDAVAHQVAVALLDDVAEMDADAKLDAPLRRHTSVAFDHAVLDFDGAAHRVDDAAELDERAVAGALDDATVMHCDGRDRSGRCAALGAAPGCGPRRHQPAGCSRRRPRPGSPRSFASRPRRPSSAWRD